MPCIVIRGRRICWIPDPPAARAALLEEPLPESILDTDMVVGIAPNDDLLSNTPGTNISNDLVSTTTDYLGATSSLNDDIDRLGNVSNPDLETLMQSSSDPFAIAEDIIAVDLAPNSTFL